MVGGEAYHRSKSDEANKRVWRKQAQAHNQRVLESFERVLLLAGIDDKQEDGRGGCGAREHILNGGVVGRQLERPRIGADVLVVRRKLVALQTERAYPQLCAGVDLTASPSAPI